MTTVPFTDLAAMTKEIWPAIERDYLACLLGAGYIGGPAVESFEREWAAYCGADHAVGVANGTDALQLSLTALGIGPGDEVVVPANTFVATAAAVVRAGADHSGRSGDERVRWDDDLIAGPDPECSQAELQCIGPVGDTHAVIGATVGGPLALEGLDGRAADVTGAEQAG